MDGFLEGFRAEGFDLDGSEALDVGLRRAECSPCVVLFGFMNDFSLSALLAQILYF